MLYEDFDTAKNFLDGGEGHFRALCTQSVEISTNLRPSIQLREYQKEALGRLIYYLNDFQQRQQPVHLLFNMATGSGKTLIMAGAMLALYEKGFRNFIFFTRLSHIVEKTKINFLDPQSQKFLFADKVQIGQKDIRIRSVEKFGGVNTDDINVLFTTTANLHFMLNNAREGSLTLSEFEDLKVCLLADEAHNLSADTSKSLKGADRDDVISWESTVAKILESNHGENMLLEFTATARMDDFFPEVREKYADKAIYKYDLKQFRLDGYSKDVSTFEVDASLLDRALCAVLISQFRLKLAEKNGLKIKPVVLFKANRVNGPAGGIEDSQKEKIVVSKVFKASFENAIANLGPQKVDEILAIGHPLLAAAKTFFSNAHLSSSDIVREIQRDFSPQNSLTVDDEKGLQTKQFLLNTLESSTNGIRAVFATEKLNEGWDVLNLFDIVRLYDTRDAKANQPGPTTVQEAQLIGRGARYNPFAWETGDYDKRKFDKDLNHELRLLEELLFHSKTNPRYIQELRTALVESGISPEHAEKRSISLKSEIAQDSKWKKALIFTNSRERYLGNEVLSFAEANVQFDSEAEGNLYKLPTRTAIEIGIFTGSISVSEGVSLDVQYVKISSIPLNILRTALWDDRRGNFATLSRYFQGLRSTEQFLTDFGFLGSVSVKVSGLSSQLKKLTAEEMRFIARHVISKILDLAALEVREYVGSRTFRPRTIEEVFGVTKELKLDSSRDRERLQKCSDIDLSQADWFAQNEIWGTSEEKSLVSFLRESIPRIQRIYPDVLLFRNEMHFSIFSFEKGEAFYPDFLMIAGGIQNRTSEVFQIFIEPKGSQFLDSEKGFANSKEGWKQKFLLELTEKSKIIIENQKYRLIGMPFFNEGDVNPSLKETFSQVFSEKLNLG
jgi:type III restriction enzyme